MRVCSRACCGRWCDGGWPRCSRLRRPRLRTARRRSAGAATMGGAGVAAGTDAAMPIEPGGVAGVPYDLFSLSASAYAYCASATRMFRGGRRSGAGNGPERPDRAFDIDQFLIIPSSAGYSCASAIDRGCIALSLVATTYNDYSIDGLFARGHHRRDWKKTSFDGIPRQIFGGRPPCAGSGIVCAWGGLFASYTTLEVDARPSTRVLQLGHPA
jgi:hypothetical protein